MASSESITKAAWGKASKSFAAYLNIAGQEIKKAAAKKLANAGKEFLENEDWDWPRGARFTAMNMNTGKTFRASGTYASGFRGGDSGHPWYTGNLHDSLAVGVIQGARILAKAQMAPGAYILQEYKHQAIDGALEGEAALFRAARTFAPGQAGDTLRAVLVIGVPYAKDVNKMPNHAGFVEALQDDFYSTILPQMNSLRKIKLRLKP